jgi:hypothetical protein
VQGGRRAHDTERHHSREPWRWLAGGIMLFIPVLLVGTDLLGLQPDMYYLIYFSIAMAWFAVFLSRYAAELHDRWRHNLGVSVAVGAVAGGGWWSMAFSEGGTNHPDGWWFGFESAGVAWSTAASMR